MVQIKISLPSVSTEKLTDENGMVNQVWARFFWDIWSLLGSGSGNITISGDLIHDGSNVGLYGVTPVARQSKINDPAGGGTVDAEARAAINSIIDALETIGITSDV